MMKKRYRNRYEIINEVLVLALRNQGLIISHILSKVNLSYKVWRRLSLVEKGLIEYKKDGRFLVTGRGRQYMKLYYKMSKLLSG